MFASAGHKAISWGKLTNEGVGRFFWDTPESIWVMKQMHVLHTQ